MEIVYASKPRKESMKAIPSSLVLTVLHYHGPVLTYSIIPMFKILRFRNMLLHVAFS